MENDKKRIAIIPARGGSKRIPNKNIINFAGKHMIGWTIEAALKSKAFLRVIVSTDDERIADISRDYAAEVPFMREGNSDDNTQVSLATAGALVQAEKHWETEFDEVVQLMPNCPLRDNKDIDEALNAFSENNREFQISCFKFGCMNPWWAFKFEEEKKDTKLFPDAFKKRSQDLPDLYCPTGSIWIAKGKKLKRTKNFYGKEQFFEPINWISAIDIDDYNDLDLACALYEIKKNKKT